MKKEIHSANYRKVIFEDVTSGQRFLLWSAVATEEKAKWEDGQEYDLYKTEISSASHPFYTGQDTSIDRAGRAERFKKRASRAATKKAVAVEETPTAETSEETSTEENAEPVSA